MDVRMQAEAFGGILGGPAALTSSTQDAYTAILSNVARPIQLVPTTPAGLTGRTGWRAGVGQYVVSAVFLATTLTTSAPVVENDALLAAARQVSASTAPASIGDSAQPARRTRRAVAAPADLIRELHTRSGLTWEQIARLLGISRRAAHQWAAGARITSRHHELLSSAVALVEQTNTIDPIAARAVLLAPRAGRASLFDEFRQIHHTRADISGMPPAEAAFKLAEP
jgi:DNA-binding transcriptional regulator YiaG